jgi:probable phosphoglycerate mutase
MGEWSGRYHSEISKPNPLFDPLTGLLDAPAPGGEWYGDVEARLRSWLASRDGGDHLVIMHEMSSRVLRGIMTNLENHPKCGSPIARGLPQGSVSEVCDGTESLLRVDS